MGMLSNEVKGKFSLKFKTICVICAATLITSMLPVQGIAYASEQVYGDQQSSEQQNQENTDNQSSEVDNNSTDSKSESDSPGDESEVAPTDSDNKTYTDTEDIESGEINEDVYDWEYQDIENSIQEGNENSSEYDGSLNSVNDFNSLLSYLSAFNESSSSDISNFDTDSTIGDGTEESPYLIFDSVGFYKTVKNYCTELRNGEPVYISLQNDLILDADVFKEHNLSEWRMDFQGILFGNNHTVEIRQGLSEGIGTDVTMNANTKEINSYGGLFKLIKNKAKIFDLNVYADYSVGLNREHCGVLADSLSGSVEVSNTCVGGTIAMSGEKYETNYTRYIGGLIGKVRSGSELIMSNVSNCVNITTDIDKDNCVGGLIGVSDDAQIVADNCSNNSGASITAVPKASPWTEALIFVTGVAVNIGFSFAVAYYKQKKEFLEALIQQNQLDANEQAITMMEHYELIDKKKAKLFVDTEKYADELSKAERELEKLHENFNHDIELYKLEKDDLLTQKKQISDLYDEESKLQKQIDDLSRIITQKEDLLESINKLKQDIVEQQNAFRKAIDDATTISAADEKELFDQLKTAYINAQVQKVQNGIHISDIGQKLRNEIAGGDLSLIKKYEKFEDIMDNSSIGSFAYINIDEFKKLKKAREDFLVTTGQVFKKAGYTDAQIDQEFFLTYFSGHEALDDCFFNTKDGAFKHFREIVDNTIKNNKNMEELYTEFMWDLKKAELLEKGIPEKTLDSMKDNFTKGIGDQYKQTKPEDIIYLILTNNKKITDPEMIRDIYTDFYSSFFKEFDEFYSAYKEDGEALINKYLSKKMSKLTNGNTLKAIETLKETLEQKSVNYDELKDLWKKHSIELKNNATYIKLVEADVIPQASTDIDDIMNYVQKDLDYLNNEAYVQINKSIEAVDKHIEDLTKEYTTKMVPVQEREIQSIKDKYDLIIRQDNEVINARKNDIAWDKRVIKDRMDKVQRFSNYDFNDYDFLDYAYKFKDDSSWKYLSKGLYSGVNWYYSLSDSLNAAINSLPVAEGGYNKDHASSYGGGFIGRYNGSNNDKSKMVINNFSNCAGIVAGTDAGGVAGYVQNASLYFNNVANYGSVACTDYGLTPSSGGIVGCYCNVGYSRECSINNTLNYGCVVSRESVGGIFGEIRSCQADVKISNTGSACAMAGEDSLGGLVGWFTSSYHLDLTNCFSVCSYDSSSMTDYSVGLSNIPAFGFKDFVIHDTNESYDQDSVSGAFIGQWNEASTSKLSVANCYYNEGYSIFGSNFKDESILNEYSEEFHEYNLNQFATGEVTYKLNNGSQLKNQFGQFIDDVDNPNFERNWFPIPGLNEPVYKDDFNAQIVYSNYNPRTVKLNHVYFTTKNATVDPGISVVNVKDGQNFDFKVSPNDGYSVDDVTLRIYPKDNVNEPSDVKTIKPYNKDDQGVLYFAIENIASHINIVVEGKEIQATQPSGLGTENAPYRVKTREELLWINKVINENYAINTSFELCNDIDCRGLDWKPLCQSYNGLGYKGHFNGNNHTLYNLSSSAESENAFFACINGGTVEDLSLQGSFRNAGIAYYANKATIQGCSYSGTLNCNDSICGGLVAIASGITMRNCNNYATITANFSKTDYDNCVGGLVGMISGLGYMYRDDASDSIEYDCGNLPENGVDNKVFVNEISNSNNVGEIKFGSNAYAYAGGLVGKASTYFSTGENRRNVTKPYTVKFDHCTNSGNIASISGEDLSAGGLVGTCVNLCANISLDYCTNYGNVGVDNNNKRYKIKHVGGWVGESGHWEDISWSFSNSLNFGNLCSYNGAVGNAIGLLGSHYFNTFTFTVVSGKIKINNCALTGNVYTENHNFTEWNKIGEVFGSYEESNWFALTDWNISKLYCIDDKNIDQVGGDGAYGGDIISDLTYISPSDVYGGGLAYRLNGHPTGSKVDSLDKYENDTFVQDLGEIGKYDSTGDATPHIYNSNVDNVKYTVYPNKIDATHTFKTAKVDYVNEKPVVDEFGYSYVSFLIEGRGSLEGPSFIKNNESAEYKVVNKSGYQLKSIIKSTDSTQTNLYDGSDVFKIDNISQDTTYLVKFSADSNLKFDESQNAYVINNEVDLNTFARMVNSGKNNINAILGSDIDITTSVNRESIGTSNRPFSGKFDGKGHTITSIVCNSIFGKVDSATIQNLNLNCSYCNSTEDSVLINNAHSCVIDNVNITGSYDLSWYKSDSKPELGNFGAFIGQMDKDAKDVEISHCNSALRFTGRCIEANSSFYACGAFIGNMEGGALTASDCHTNGSYSIESCDENVYMGGLIGYIHYNVYSLDILGFENSASLTSPNDAAGLVGKIDWMDKRLYAQFKISSNNGVISGKDYVGGFIANIQSAVKEKVDEKELSPSIEFVGCQNNGDILGYDDPIGGFIGCVNDGDQILIFESCLNVCNKIYRSDNDNEYSGGFVGYVDNNDTDKSTINNCFSFIQTPCLVDSKEKTASYIGHADHLFSTADFNFTNCFISSGDSCNIHNEGGSINNKINDDGIMKRIDSSNIFNGALCFEMSQNFASDMSNVVVWIQYESKTSNKNDLRFGIGQSLDAPGSRHRGYPYIGDCRVHKFESCGVTYYSNVDRFSSYAPEKYNLMHVVLVNYNTNDTQFSDFSKDVSLPASLSENMTYSFHLESADSNNILNSLKINGVDYNLTNEYIGKTLTISYRTIFDYVVKSIYKDNVPADIHDKQEYVNEVNEYLKSNGLVLNYGFGYETKPNLETIENNEQVYMIGNAHELVWFMNYVNNTNEGKNAKMSLTNNIDMAGFRWNSLCSSGSFSGTIYGNGYTIKNLICSEGGFIRNASGAEISDINLEVYVDSNDIGCVIVSSYNCLLRNVVVEGEATGTNINTYGGLVGCVRGNASYTKIVEEFENSNQFGKNGSRIYNCVNNVKFNPKSMAANAMSGGLVGKFLDNSSLSIYGSTNNSVVYANKSQYGLSSETNWAGGICGYVSCNSTNLRLEAAINKGNVYGYYAAGLVSGLGGYSSSANLSKIDILYSENHGDVYGLKAGGVCSSLLDAGANSYVHITGVLNWGKVVSNATKNSNSMAAGAIAYMDDGDIQVKMNNFINYGEVSAYKYAGGFYGYVNRVKTGSLVDASLSWGEVNSYGFAGYEASYFACLNCWDDHVEISNSHARAYNCSEHAKVGKDSDDEAKFVNNDYNSYEYPEKFKSGQICYLLNKSGQQKNFVQIIDDYSYGDKMYCPVLKNYFNRINLLNNINIDDHYPYVYKRADGTYSNFNNEDYVCVNVVHDDSAAKAEDKSSYLATICKLNDGGTLGSDIEGVNYVPKGKPFEFCVDAVDGAVVESITITNEITGESKTLDYSDVMIYKTDPINDKTTISVRVSKFKQPSTIVKDGVSYYAITNYSELLWFANYVNTGHPTASCVLERDIYCSQYGASSWKPIGTDQYYFSGSINGQGHQIIGLYHENYKNPALAFIYKGDGFTVKDLTLKDFDFGADQVVAGLVDYAMNNFEISNVNVDGQIHSSGIAMAGLIAHVYKTKSGSNEANINNCTTKVSMNNATCKHGRVGGIAAYIHEGVNVNFNNCNNLSICHSNKYSDGYSMTYDDYAGGIFAYASANATKIKCFGCKNLAEIKGNTSGGIAGTVDDGGDKSCVCEISDCDNFANVSGEDCGGILGQIDDVTKSSDGTRSSLVIKRCTNNAMIGTPCAVLNNVGGIVGNLSDGDLAADLDSCVNYGYIINDDLNPLNRSFTFFVTSILNFGLDIFNIWDDATDALAISSIIGKTAMSGLKRVAFIVFVAVEAVSFVENFVVDVVTGRQFILQYAGGIAGQFDSLYSLNLNRVINMSYAKGKSWEDPISNDYPSSSKVSMDNVYTLSSEEAYRTHNDNVTYCNADTMSEGRVGYEMQQSEINSPDDKKVGKWGQIIDNLRLGPVMGTPFMDMFTEQENDGADAKIYKHVLDDKRTVYSNFDNIDEAQINDLTLEFAKDEFSTNPDNLTINEANGDIKNLFNVSVNSSFANSENVNTGTESTEDAKTIKDKYSVRQLSNETIVLKPKKQNYAITDISIDGVTNITEASYVEENEDGSFVKYYKPVKNSKGKVMSYDCKIIYDVDSTVTIQMGLYNDSNRVIKVNFTDNPIKVEFNTIKDKNQIMFPWNNPSKLPVNTTASYLNCNIDLSDTVIYLSNTDECIDFNGKSVKLVNNASINVEENASLGIFDSWNFDSTNTVTFSDNEFKVGEGTGTKAESTDKDSIKLNGVIYKENKLDSMEYNMFAVSGKLSISNVAILQNNNVAAVCVPSKANPEISLNSTIYKAPTNTINKNHSTIVVLNNLEDQNLMLLDDFKVVDFGIEENTLYNPDFLLGANNVDIVFNPEVSVERPYTVSSLDTIDKAYICKNFNNVLNLSKNYDEFFTSAEDSKCIALSGSGDKSNMLCLASKTSCATVNIENPDKYVGEMYPNGKVNYVSGSDVFVFYCAYDFNVLYKAYVTYNGALKDYCNDESFLIKDQCGAYTFAKVDLDKVKGIDSSTDQVYLTIKPEFKNLNKANTDECDYYDTVDWNSNNSLPTQATNKDGEPLMYKLQNDITLNEQWVAPVGYMAIDLNGHSIYQTKDGDCIMRINNADTHLSIFDRASDSDKHDNPHYFKRNQDSTYSIVENEEDADETIYGGILSGVNAKPVTYYTYTQDAGAIVVESGSCQFNGGAIAGNKLDGILGGAAVYVKSEGSFNLGEDARICFNTAKGNPDYKSRDFAAAVVNNGRFINDGSIDHNISFYYAASAVVNNGVFDNNGDINDNEILYSDTSSESSMSFAVLNTNILSVAKNICNNKSNITAPALYNAKIITLKDDANISGNSYSFDNAEVDWDILVQDSDSIINFENKINSDCITYIACPNMYTEDNQVDSFVFTKNWSNAEKKEPFFKAWDPQQSTYKKITNTTYRIAVDSTSGSNELAIELKY